jgi:hypothetical protein
MHTHDPATQLEPFDAFLQSLPLLQPQLLLLQAEPLGLFVQSTQALPEAPHVLVAPLPWHVPPPQQ